MRQKARTSIAILVFLPAILLLGYVFLPGGNIQPVDRDIESLRMAVSSAGAKNCRIEGQRHEISNPDDEDDMASMMHSRAITQISMDCGGDSVNGTVATYRTRFSALWREKGLTQCGEGYCQKAWASGRQLFIVTTTENSAKQ